MIGINVAVRAGAQGIGFAIPVDRVVAVAANLLATCNGSQTRTGVESLADATPRKGTVVGAIEPGSPAAAAGLAAGDLIVAVGDDPVDRSLDFQRAVLDRKAGETLRLAVRRSGNPLVLSLKLGAAPDSARLAGQPAWELLGVELKPIPSDEFRKAHTTHYRGGLAVVAVRPDSPAGSQGILPGDVLVGMHIWETLSLDNVAYIIKRPDFPELGPVKFFILRGDETLYGYLPAPAAKTAQR
jgi:serine protease Do